ncbi:MAG: histidinol-phosphate transaminase [Acidobacteria bacterium]|nr:MAG: histidinol-phosphate transaminase [Acidobacteriota bacterium]PYR22858.1 MAG: histidinol-phosphate transaminase [Acidobacteriota bacterium]
MSHYQKPPELYGGLRLHQNENTGGCSPRVTEALARLRADQVGFYPPYAAATDAVAMYLGVPPDRVTLTNGLDEGLMALSVAYLRAEIGGPVLEAIVPEPAFEIFRLDTEVAGGKLVQVMPKADFAFPLDEVLAAVTPNTRVVFLTNPNNPTGVSMPLGDIRAVARGVPAGAIVFVDEAYAEFADESFIPELDAFPNVVVGRTFSKAFGLAGLRIGCLVSAPATVDPIRRAVPVYSVSVAAVAAIQAALSDLDHMRGYLRQVTQSKALLYAACDRLGLTYWKSRSNFVLVCAGDRTDALVNGAFARGVYLRDRSTEPGCAGCLRITTGIVDHTRRAIAVMEEVLCAAR